MNRTDTLLRLKRFRVDEMKRRMASIEAMKSDLEKKLSDLDDNVTREKQRAGDSDQEIAHQKRRDLPAGDVEPETTRGRLIETQRIEIEPDPRSLKPPHQDEGDDQHREAENEVAEIERQFDTAD